MGEKRKTFKLMVEKPRGRRPLGLPRYKQVDNVKIILGQYWVVWIEMLWHRMEISGELFFEYGYEPSDSIQFWKGIELWPLE
jgi:hypothetical protein